MGKVCFWAVALGFFATDIHANCATAIEQLLGLSPLETIEDDSRGHGVYKLTPFNDNDFSVTKKQKARDAITAVVNSEIKTLRKFQFALPAHYSVVSLSHINGRPVPGFDGIVIDENGDARYNISIKQVPIWKAVEGAFMDAFKKIHDVSTLKRFGRKSGNILPAVQVKQIFGIYEETMARDSVIVLDLLSPTDFSQIREQLDNIRSILNDGTRNLHVHSVYVLVGRVSAHYPILASGRKTRKNRDG